MRRSQSRNEKRMSFKVQLNSVTFKRINLFMARAPAAACMRIGRPN